MGILSKNVLFCSRKTLRFGTSSFSVSPYRLLYDAGAVPELFHQLQACRSVLLVVSREFIVPQGGGRSVWRRLRLPVVEAEFSAAFKQCLSRRNIRVRGIYVQVFDWLFVPVLLSTLLWRVAALILLFLVPVMVTCGLGGWRISHRIVALGEWQQGIGDHASQRWQQLRAIKGQEGLGQKVLDQYHWLRTLPLTLEALKIGKGQGQVSGLISKVDWRRLEKKVDAQGFAALVPKLSKIDVLPSGVLHCKLVFRF